MKLLKDRILKDGKSFEGGILKVDSFINHQMDPILMKSIGVEFVRRFGNMPINKVVTIEASGIAPAIMLGYLLELPVVFVKHAGDVPMYVPSRYKEHDTGASTYTAFDVVVDALLTEFPLTVAACEALRGLLEPARAAEIAATEANVKQIGEHLRAIHKASGGLQLP